MEAHVAPARDDVAVLARLVAEYRVLLRELRISAAGSDDRTRLLAREAALSRVIRTYPHEVMRRPDPTRGAPG